MKIRDLPMQQKKKGVVLLHILFLALVLTGISIMYSNTHYGQGLNWLADETYEDTEVFSSQIKADIDEIFNYVNYKEVFETNDKLDFQKPIVTINTGPEGSRTFTLDEMIREAKSRGLYLNENFKISGVAPANGPSKKDDESIMVEWRAYDPNLKVKEPGDYYTKMDSLVREVLSHLGNYYSSYYKFIQTPSNLQFRILYKNTDSDYKLYSNTPLDSVEQFKALGKYLYVTGESAIVDNNLNPAPQNVTTLLESNNPYDNSNYYLMAAVDTSYPCQDPYAVEAASYFNARALYILGMISLFLGLLGCIATVYYLILVSGFHENGDKFIHLHSFDRVTTESCLLLSLIAIFCSLFLGEKIGYPILHLFVSRDSWYYAEKLLRLSIVYAVCIITGFSLLRRYKARVLWSNSLMKKVAASSSLYIDHHDFTVRLGIYFSLFMTFNIITLVTMAYLFFNHGNLSSVVLMIILVCILIAADFWVFHQLYKNALQNNQINEAVFRISGGNTGYKIDTAGFFGKEKEMAENINHISMGLEAALQEKVKSERLKTDLITNVSHDIKTPLTSIINYVDLIKRENPQNEKIQEYLEVLEQKSQRLKTLTEDLVEASKASSGNLKLEITNIDLVELVQQTNGEFEEKFALRHLELVSQFPEEIIIIEADGRYLWRVLENLYNNAFKYAMERSRIYIDIAKEDSTVTFTIKNISENALNIKADDLTERFVRGDVARTTEGSGLGLSIAKSLTELQKGSFQIYIDGDLFKVQIRFPVK